MCGIAGYYTPGRPILQDRSLAAMARHIARRGPDSNELLKIDARAGEEPAEGMGPFHDLGIVHSRFSIIAPSAEGNQPFWTHDRALCVAFNGEIYNHVEIRDQLQSKGHEFRTRTDTEVLLEAYRAWGPRAFPMLSGFWAIAIFDTRSRRLLLARDRHGKAPLYITNIPGGFAWASEIKALREIAPADAFSPDPRSIVEFALHGWRDVHDATFYSGVRSFPAASYSFVSDEGTLDPVRYWSIPEHRASEHDISPGEAVRGFRERFLESVSLRLRADVPLAFELSGGMDSSAILAAAAELGTTGDAYTVQWPDQGADETPYAKAVISRYGTRFRHHLVSPPADDFWEDADDYLGVMDEPIHSPNLHSNYRVWGLMAKHGYRVTLNGGAGDELLAGYRSDHFAPFIRDRILRGEFRRAWAEMSMHSEAAETAVSRFVSPLLDATGVTEYLRRHVRPRHRAKYLRGLGSMPIRGYRQDIAGRMIDLMGEWRMNYWLRAGNQSSMAVPIEVRAPFLDHHLVDYVFTMPMGYLIRDGWHKWILRKAFEGSLPEDVVWRKRKMGFPFPLGKWLLESEPKFWSAAGRDLPPFINADRMKSDYRQLAVQDPNTLWRLVSIALWWKKSIQGRSLAA